MKSTTACSPGRSSARPGPGRAAATVARAMAACDIFWPLDTPLRVSVSKISRINRVVTAPLGFPQLPLFIRPTAPNVLVTSKAGRRQEKLQELFLDRLNIPRIATKSKHVRSCYAHPGSSPTLNGPDEVITSLTVCGCP